MNDLGKNYFCDFKNALLKIYKLNKPYSFDMLGRKRGEGRPLPDTEDMKIWREEFNQMTLEEHDRILKNLGLDEEDIKEFNEAAKKGKKVEDLLGIDEGTELEEKPQQKKKK